MVCNMHNGGHEPWINRLDEVDLEMQATDVLADLQTEKNPLTKFMMRLEAVIGGLRLMAVRPLTRSQVSFRETRSSDPSRSAPDAL
jgi:hypothetical protein